MKRLIRASLFALCALALLAGCSTTPTMDTRAVEERYFGVGYARHMYAYGEDLLRQGRYREAQQAFQSAESSAYVTSLREAARARRMWVEQAIAAYERGDTPPPLPYVTTTGVLDKAPPPPPAPPAQAPAEPPAAPAAEAASEVPQPRLVPLTPAPPQTDTGVPETTTGAVSGEASPQGLTPLTPPAGRTPRSLEPAETSLSPAPK